MPVPYYDSDHTPFGPRERPEGRAIREPGNGDRSPDKGWPHRSHLSPHHPTDLLQQVGAVTAMHARPSQTTRRLRYGDDDLIAPVRLVREHRRPDGWKVPTSDGGDDQHQRRSS